MIKQYRKKPVVIEATQFPQGSNSQFEVAQWLKENGADARLYDMNVRMTEEPLEDGSHYYWSSMGIVTLEGVLTAQVGDFIIKGVQGEFYPCKPDIFHQTYDEVI